MASKAMYEYSVVYHDPKDGDKDEVVVAPKTVLAKDASHANRLALRAVPAEWDDRLEYLEVLVRSF